MPGFIKIEVEFLHDIPGIFQVVKVFIGKDYQPRVILIKELTVGTFPA